MTLSQSDKVSSNTGINRPSISKAKTFFAALAKRCVNAPIPGPISMTFVSLLTSATSNIFVKIFGSIKKFCPKLFFTLMPWRSIISRVRVGVAISFSNIFLAPFLYNLYRIS